MGSSRSVRVGARVRGYTRVRGGTAGVSQQQPGLRQRWGRVWCPLGDEPRGPARPPALSAAFVWELRRRQREIEWRALLGGGRTSSIPPPASQGNDAPHSPAPPPQPPPSEVLASAGCLICRKPRGYGAELPRQLPSLVSCLCKLVRASLSLVTLMMRSNWSRFPTNTSPHPPWPWDFTGVLASFEGTGTYLKRRKRKS